MLIVDDEALLRWSRLAKERHSILEAGTVAEALEQLSPAVDLVLLDFRLPMGTGLPCSAASRSSRRGRSSS